MTTKIIIKSFRQFYNQHLTENIKAVMDEYQEEIDDKIQAHIKARLSTLLALEMQGSS